MDYPILLHYIFSVENVRLSEAIFELDAKLVQRYVALVFSAFHFHGAYGAVPPYRFNLWACSFHCQFPRFTNRMSLPGLAFGGRNGRRS